MPFTGAHPFAVLPAIAMRRRLRLDITCLVIGSMAPDLEYFTRGYMYGWKLGHMLIGLVVWCLPVTLAYAAVYHLVVKRPLVGALPRPIATRAAGIMLAEPWPSVPWPMLGVSAIVGAATHLFWDGFTHTDAFFILWYPSLDPYTYGAQIVCSIVGLIGLAIALAIALRRAPPVDPPAPRARWAFLVFPLLGAIAFVARLYLTGRFRSGDLMVAPVSGVMYGLIAAGLVARWR